MTGKQQTAACLITLFLLIVTSWFCLRVTLANEEPVNEPAEIVSEDVVEEMVDPSETTIEEDLVPEEPEVEEDAALLQQRQAQTRYQTAVLKRHTLHSPFTGVISRKRVAPGEWVAPGDGLFELVATESLRLDFAVAEDYLSRIDRSNTLVVSAGGRCEPSLCADGGGVGVRGAAGVGAAAGAQPSRSAAAPGAPGMDAGDA